MLLKWSEKLNAIAVSHSILCCLWTLKAMHWCIIDVKVSLCFCTFQLQFCFFHRLLDMLWSLKLRELSSRFLITMYKSWRIVRFYSYFWLACVILPFTVAFLRIISKSFIIQRRWLTLHLVLARLIKWPATLIFLFLVIVLGHVLCSFVYHDFWSIQGNKCTWSLYLSNLRTRACFLFQIQIW